MRLRDRNPFPSAVFWTASCQLAPLPTLSLSLLLLRIVGIARGVSSIAPTHCSLFLGGGINPARLVPVIAGQRLEADLSSAPRNTSQTQCGFTGAWGGGLSPPLLSVLLPPSCLCVSALPPCSPPSPTPLPVSGRGDAISLSGSLQMDVVYTFQTGASSLQGALRRQPSIVSQHHDVKNVSSPTHVALSSVNSTPTTSAVAAAAASPPVGSE